MSAPAQDASVNTSRPAYWPFLRVWLSIGAQSFGGGPSTLALMRRKVVEQEQWATYEQFTRDWALCQICPGINLLGMCVLIGRKMLGTTGMLLAVLGLLLPSVVITVLLSACFRFAYKTDMLQAAVRGAIPATVGIGWLTCLHMGRGVMASAHKRGRAEIILTTLLLLASAAIFILLRPSPIVLILGAGAVAAVYRTATNNRSQEAGS